MIYGLAAVGLIALIGFVLVRSRRRPCPPGQLLVVYGAHIPGGGVAVVTDRPYRVLPIVQDHAYLSLEPIRLRAPYGYLTVRISSDLKLAENAAIHLLNYNEEQIEAQARQLLDDRDDGADIRTELRKLGLEVVDR